MYGAYMTLEELNERIAAKAQAEQPQQND
jgi:hypothetical protein